MGKEVASRPGGLEGVSGKTRGGSQQGKAGWNKFVCCAGNGESAGFVVSRKLMAPRAFWVHSTYTQDAALSHRIIAEH